MSFSFEGPSTDIIFATWGGMLLGGFYSDLAKTNQLPALIFATRELADWILFRSAVLLSNSPCDRTCAKIYAFTNLTVNMGTLCLLRKMDLIGQIGTSIFLGLMALEMACKYADLSRYRVEPLT